MADRCSPENPCEADNPLHRALYGQCWVRLEVLDVDGYFGANGREWMDPALAGEDLGDGGVAQ